MMTETELAALTACVAMLRDLNEAVGQSVCWADCEGGPHVVDCPQTDICAALDAAEAVLAAQGDPQCRWTADGPMGTVAVGTADAKLAAHKQRMADDAVLIAAADPRPPVAPTPPAPPWTGPVRVEQDWTWEILDANERRIACSYDPRDADAIAAALNAYYHG